MKIIKFKVEDDGVFEFEARGKKTKMGIVYICPVTEEKLLITEYEKEGHRYIIKEEEKTDFIEKDNKIYLAV